jgi:hypothetical protein
MTVARKLGLVFGIVILTCVLGGLAILSSERAVKSALDETTSFEEPTRVAAHDIEINATEISRDVLGYMGTGDPRIRERFADDKSDEGFEGSRS